MVRCGSGNAGRSSGKAMSDDFKNDLSFSASREAMLDRCSRQFYYAVYLMWNGWWNRNKKPEPRRAAAYNAKHATTEAALAGSIVHIMAEWAINQAKRDTSFFSRFGGREGIRDHMHSMAGRRIDEALAQARSQIRGSPKKWTQLVSINNGGEADEAWLRDRVRTRIDALCAEDEAWDNEPTPEGAPRPHINLLVRAVNAADRVVHCEELIEWNIWTTFGQVKAFLKHDLVMRSPREPSTCTIVDWKTGKDHDENGEQLDFYSAWAASNGWQRAYTALVYLGDGKTSVRWSEADMDAAVQSVAIRTNRFVGSLRERLVDKDIAQNEPIESAFESTTNAYHCRSCSFAQLCERDGTKPR